jgi:hypothetical protein
LTGWLDPRAIPLEDLTRRSRCPIQSASSPASDPPPVRRWCAVSPRAAIASPCWRATAIADVVRHVVHQDRSAWSFNVEVKPYGEVW